MSWAGQHLALIVGVLAGLIWLVALYLALWVLQGIKLHVAIKEWVLRRF